MKVLFPVALLAGLIAQSGFGQQNVPFDPKFHIPVAPQGLAHKPLPKLPMEFDTAEGMRIRVVAVTRQLEYPISMAFLPDGSILIPERYGQLRIVRNGKLDPKPVAGVPASFGTGESGSPGAVHGLQDIALHPKFEENHLVYLVYTKANDPKRSVAIARAHWDGQALVDCKDIFNLGQASTSRIAFGADGMLYMVTTGNDPQDPNTLGGKVLRLRDDGTVPDDNPFAGQPGHRPEVYTLGHRSSLGLTLHAASGEIWESENGPNGGDEINILKPGRNYGWPKVSYGRDYPGPWHVSPPGHVGFEAPVVIWIPAIAVSGMTFYTGDKLPKWKGDLFVGALRTGEIPGTGHIERILFNQEMQELRRESLLTEFRQRVRDIRQGPDGYLYLVTDENPGALLRIEPAQ